MHKSEFMQFRAPPELAKALSAAAEREGVSQSELIRQAVAGRVGCSTASTVDPDPYERIVAAARGDLQAMRDLANLAMRNALDPTSGADACKQLIEGLVFARMAATHGHIADQGLVISMLALLSKTGADDDCAGEHAEAIARLALVGDFGDDFEADLVSQHLPFLADDADPEIMALAKEIRSRLRDDVKREKA